MKNIYIEKALLLLDAEQKNLLFFQSKPQTTTKDTKKETQKKSPEWRGTKNELMELVTALHASKVFCDEYGVCSSMIELVKFFNCEIANFHIRRNQILDRKRESTPFLRKLIDAYNLVIEKRNK